MARVKRAVNAQKKRRDMLDRASGYRGQRSRLYRKAKEQVTHSLVYAYADRRNRKGDFRRLWIQRINAAARANGMTYNRFVQGLKAAGVEVDRRMLAEMAVNDAPAFAALVEVAQGQPAGRRRSLTTPGAVPEPRSHRVTSVTSDRVTAVRSLHARQGRRKAGRFVVEGPQAVRSALANGVLVHDLFVDEDTVAFCRRRLDRAGGRRPAHLGHPGGDGRHVRDAAAAGRPCHLRPARSAVISTTSWAAGPGAGARGRGRSGQRRHDDPHRRCRRRGRRDADPAARPTCTTARWSGRRPARCSTCPVLAEPSHRGDRRRRPAGRTSPGGHGGRGSPPTCSPRSMTGLVDSRTCWVIGSEAHGASPQARAAADLRRRDPDGRAARSR